MGYIVIFVGHVVHEPDETTMVLKPHLGMKKVNQIVIHKI